MGGDGQGCGTINSPPCPSPPILFKSIPYVFLMRFPLTFNQLTGNPA